MITRKDLATLPRWTPRKATMHYAAKGIGEFSRHVLNREEVLKNGNSCKVEGYLGSDRQPIALCDERNPGTDVMIGLPSRPEPGNGRTDDEVMELNRKLNDWFDERDRRYREDYTRFPDRYTTHGSKSGSSYTLIDGVKHFKDGEVALDSHRAPASGHLLSSALPDFASARPAHAPKVTKPTVDYVKRNAKRYGKRSTGKHWRELEAIVKELPQ